MNLNECPRIIGLANALSLDVINPVEAIRTFCREKVERFLRGAGRVPSMVELQRIVCVHLNLTVHEVWSDEDLDVLTRQYAAAKEIVFLTLSNQLTPDAFGVLFRLSKQGRRPRFVAVIDCRGDKRLRRHWTLWHEIAHALTDVEQFQLPLRRTTVNGPEKDPIEQITDIVASDFAFFAPIFMPVFRRELGKETRVSFELVNRVRHRFCGEASAAATLNACVAAAPMPTIYLEAKLGHKKAEMERIQQGETGIVPSLRVLKSVPNAAARDARLHIPQNMRVPAASVIARVHSEGADVFSTHSASTESLSEWTTSQGGCLPNVEVVVEAKLIGDRVVAIVTAL